MLYSQSTPIDADSPECLELFDLLHRVLDCRVNTDYSPEGVEPEYPSLKSFKRASLEVYNLLCREAHFHQKFESSLFKLGIGKTPVPFTRYPCQITSFDERRIITNTLY